MADGDGKLPSEEQQEQDIEKVPVVLNFIDNRYHCKLCRNHTQSRNAFEEHIASHCLLRPYVCFQCKTTFRLKAEMDKHVQLNHKNKKVRCGMQGMKKVDEHMKPLLKQGTVTFEGFPRKKMDGGSVSSAVVGSKRRFSVNNDNKAGDKKETTEKSTQESENPSKSADSSESVLREDDNDKSKVDNGRVTGESVAVDGSEGEATQDRKTQVTRAISKTIDQSVSDKRVSKNTDRVGVSSLSVGTSAGDIDKNSTHQSEMQVNVSTCELGEGTSASTSKTDDTSNITSGQNHNVQSRQLEPGYLSQKKASKTAKMNCDVEDNILDSDDKSRLGSTVSDTLQSCTGQEESTSAKPKPTSISEDKNEQKTVESEQVSDRHFQINSEQDESECNSSNVMKDPGCSDLSRSRSSENVSLISAKSSNVSSAQLKSGSSAYETQGSDDADSYVSSLVSSINSKCTETSKGREKSSAIGNTQNPDLNKQQQIVDESLPEELIVKSHLHQQITRVTPPESNMAANVLTESETSINLLPQPTDLAKFQSPVQSKTLQMASGPNTHSSISSAEKILVMQQSGDKSYGKYKPVEVCSSNSPLTDSLPQISDAEISVPLKETSAFTTKKSNCVLPTSKEENLHTQEEIPEVSVLRGDSNQEKEGTHEEKESNTHSTNYVRDLSEISSDTKIDEQVRSPVSGPPRDKGQELAAATSEDARDGHGRQDEANKDLPLTQEGQLNAATDQSLPQRQEIISAAAQDHLILPTAATDKGHTRDKTRHLTTTVDQISEQDQQDQSTAKTCKDSPTQSPGNQLNAAADKGPTGDKTRHLTTTVDQISEQDQQDQSTATTCKETPQSPGNQLNAATDKGLTMDKTRHLTTTVDQISEQDQKDQSTATTCKHSPPQSPGNQLNAAADKGLTMDKSRHLTTTVDQISEQDQQDQSTATTCKETPQSPGNQLNAATDKGGGYDQGRLLTSTANNGTPQVEGRTDISSADEGSLQEQGQEVTSSMDKDPQQEKETSVISETDKHAPINQLRQPIDATDTNYPPEQQEQHTTASDKDSLLTKQHQSISTIDTDLTQNQVILPTEAGNKNPLHEQGRSLTAQTDNETVLLEGRQLDSSINKGSLQNQGRLLTTAAGTCLTQDQGPQIIAVTDKDHPHDQGSVLASTIDKDSPLAEDRQLGAASGGDSSEEQGRLPTTTVDRNLIPLESSSQKVERDDQPFNEDIDSSEENMIAAPSENVTEVSDGSAREYPDKQELKEKEPTNPSSVDRNSVFTQPLTSTKPSGASDSQSMSSDEDFHFSQESYSEMLTVSDENEWIVKSNLSTLHYSGTHAANYISSDSKSSSELKSAAGERPSVGKQLPDSSDQSSTTAVPSTLKEKGNSSPKFKTMLERNVYQQRTTTAKHPVSRQGTSDNPQPVQKKQDTQERDPELEKLKQIQVQGPSALVQQKPQDGNQPQGRGLSPVPQQTQVQVVNQPQGRGLSPVPQQTQGQVVNQPQVRGFSPVPQQAQVQIVNMPQVRGLSPVPQQTQVQIVNMPQVRGPSPVPQQTQVQVVNQPQGRGPSPVPQQQTQVQGVNQPQGRGPSLGPQQQRQVQDGNPTVVRSPSPVYAQQQTQAVIDVNDYVLQEHEKIMAARMSIFNLTQPRERLGITSTAPNNSSVSNLNMLQTNNPSPQSMSCQVVGTPMASNQVRQSRASLPSPRQPVGQFMAIVPETSMATGIRVGPLNTMQQVRIQGNTNRQQSGLPFQLSSFPQILGVAPAGFPNSNPAIQPNILQMQQQGLLPQQANLVQGVPQGQTTLVSQQVPGIIGRMPGGIVISSQARGFIPPYILSQDGTLRSTQFANSTIVQTQAQVGSQTQVRGRSPVSMQQQTQTQSGNQKQVRGPSPVSLQQQTQSGSQTQVRGPSPVSVQSKESAKPVGKISKLTSLKANIKIAELFRKSRGDKQLQNTESPQVAEPAVSDTQTSSIQPDTETATVKPDTGNVTEQPVSANVKKKGKGNFRKVGPDYLCISCKIETQSEKDFCRHIWTHFHIARNLCTGCRSSAENSSKCQLVMSVIDGLKYGCSVGSSDAEPIQIKTEPDDDDDVVLVEHIPPPKKARHSTMAIKQEATQIASSKNRADVSVTRERETTVQEMVSSDCTTESSRQETTSGVFSAEAEQRDEIALKDCQKESWGTRSSLGDETAGTSMNTESAAQGKSLDAEAEVMKDNSSTVTTDTVSTLNTVSNKEDRASASRLVVGESGRKLICQFIARKKDQAKQTKSSTAESENVRTDQSVSTAELMVSESGGNRSIPGEHQGKRTESTESENTSTNQSENTSTTNQSENTSTTQSENTSTIQSENTSTNQSVAQSAEVDLSPIPLERTTGNFYVCGGFDLCQFSCLTIADFYKHMSSVHKSAVSFLCVHCGCLCPSPQLLMRHLNSHLKKTALFFSCCISGCRFQTNLLHGYSSHLGTVHSRCTTLSCPFCETCFTSVNLLIQHIQENTLKFVKCPHCKVADTDVTLIKRHLASTHPSESRRVMVACELVCKERLKNNFRERTATNESSTTPSAGNDTYVMEVPKQADTTVQTFERLSDTSDEEEVIRANENQQPAEAPDNAVSSRPSLSLKIQATVVREISACDSTVSPTPSPSHLDGSATEEDPHSSDVDSTVSTRLQKCYQCSFTSKGKISMVRHEKIHTMKCRDEKVFACPLCPDGMATIQLFRDHMKNHIGNHSVTMYYCDLCQIAANKRETILTHGRQLHSEFNETTDISTRDMKFSFQGFVCDKCDYCTTSQTVYDKHVETHVEENPPTRKMSVDQKCPYCIYHTQDEVTYDLHITNMHQKQLNKEKRNRKSSLECDNSKRLKSVPNESESANPSSPSINSFENLPDKASVSSTATEQSHDHNDQSETSTSMMSQENVSRSQSKSNDLYQNQVAKRYRCCECPKGFSSTDQLKIHLEFHANITKQNYEIKLLRCSHCDYSTTERLWLERHNRQQHKNSSKSTKQRREVIHVGQGTTKTSNTSRKVIQPAVDKKAFLIPVQSTFSQPVACCECDFSTRDRASLVIHVTNHATLYPRFEDSTDSAEEKEKEDSVTGQEERIDDTNDVDKNSKKSDSKNLSLDTPFRSQSGNLVSEDSEQEVIDLLTDESTDEYEKDEKDESQTDGEQQFVGSNRNTSQKTTMSATKLSSRSDKVATSAHKSISDSDEVTGSTSQEEMAEAATLRPQRKSQDCDSLFRLGGDLLHVKLKPCFSQEKDNMFLCELCSSHGPSRDKYEFHKHLLTHMNLWFYMCGYCDFHCFEQSAMTSHSTKLHRNRPYQILKMEVEDFRNRINEIIHCRKAGISMSSLINTTPQESRKSRAEEDIKDARGHTSNSKGDPDSASKSQPQNTSCVERSKGVGKSSPEKDSVLGSEKSLNSQKTSGIGKVTTVGAFHKCSVCGFKSKDRNAVVRHLGVHSQVNKDHCQHCPFQSSVAGDLSLHMAKRHPETCKEKPSKTPCSRELKELLDDQNSKSARKDLSPNQGENRTSSISNQSTGKISLSASEKSTVSRTSPNVGKKSLSVLKTPKVSRSLSPLQQKGAVKTIFRHNVKKRTGLYKCNFCRYCSKWGSNMGRHMQCRHNVKIISKETAATNCNKRKEDAESNDVESSNAESDDAESSDAESDDAEINDAESDDVESSDAESDDVESGDVENSDVENSDAKSDETEIDDAESDDKESDNTQDGKKGQRKPVLYTCEVKVNAEGHFQCPLCTAILQFKSNMYRHALEVHKADIKEGYTCLYCKKDFRLRTPFLNHFKTEKCDKPWFLCTARFCTVVCLDRQKSINHMQKEHSSKKKPIVLNTRKMKLEKCLIKGNLLHRVNRQGRPSGKKDEKATSKKDEKLPSKKVETATSKKEEKSPNKKYEKPLSKKDKRAPSNLCYTKSPEMRDVHCGSCGQERNGCFAYQLHCNNKHSAQAFCCFFCKKFATISVRHMMFHTMDVHKEKVLKFYHIPKKEEHTKIAYKFKAEFKGKKAKSNKIVILINRFFDSTRKVKSPEKPKNATASPKQKKTSGFEKPKKKQTSSVSSYASEDKGNYKCMAVKGCGFASPKYDTIQIHIQRHLNYKPYKCEICGLQFYMEQYAKMHHTKVHYYEKASITVKRTAATDEKITRLIRKGEPHYFENKEFTVDDAKKLRNGPKRLYKELRGKTTSWRCVECKFETKSRKIITDHVYKHLPKIYKCPFCKHTGYPRYTVVDHMTRVHPTENVATPVINLLDKPYKKKATKDSSSESSPASNTSSESSDTDVYSGAEEENVPRAKRVTAKASSIPDQILESSDSDIAQPIQTPKTKTATIRKRARISSDSDDENEAFERKTKRQKQNRSTSKSSKTQRLSSDSDEKTEESEEEEETSTSDQDTDESSSSDGTDDEDDNNEEEEVMVPHRRKRHRPLTDGSSDEIDHGLTRYFCHQCCFRSEDLKVYCRHLVTHGGYNQLCPHHLPENLRRPVEEELGRLVDGTARNEGTTFCCAYCSFMAATSFRVKQHITKRHPDHYTDYMEIHTKHQRSEVMVVAMQPSIIMTDICKMDLMDLAMMLAHEGVRMNSGKNHECQDEGSETGATCAGSSGEKKRKKISIMRPSKYYKKSGSHTNVHQNDVLTDDKGNESLSDARTGRRTEEMMDAEEGPSSRNQDLSSGEAEQPQNIFTALVKLTQEDRTVNRGFENVLAEFLLAEEKTGTDSSRIVNVNDKDEMDVPKSSGTGKDSSGSGKSSSESKVESTKNLSLSSTVEEHLPKDENNVLEIDNSSITTEGSSLESPENSFEPKPTDTYEDISECSDGSEGQSDRLGGHQTSTDVRDKGQTATDDVWLTAVSSTTDNVDVADGYSDVSDCTDSILIQDDNLCEELPEASEVPNTALDNNFCEATSYPSSTLATKSRKSCDKEISSVGGDMRSPSQCVSTETDVDGGRSKDTQGKVNDDSARTQEKNSVTAKGNNSEQHLALSETSQTSKGDNSLSSEITGDNVMSSIDSMLDSLSDIRQTHVAESTVKHSADKDKSVKHLTDQEKPDNSSSVLSSLESQDSDNESCLSIGFEVNTDSQEL
ncbi:uncharacterized protein LOC110465661 isoform X2 [Mizuhopecten yessoensis]|uniref:uncharacterized protein LOC110465661 isoform X2 n=1 Tax=Mizuhopecten yessoensis TaxID=6573 RepID=UPI000B45C5C7|nr:uncharacterized protein LOC110465661 isoform X2 [Mizuhopecten yessoensis]